MRPEQALCDYLLGLPAVAKLVGSRVSPNTVPQSQPGQALDPSLYPHVVFYRSATERKRGYKGVAGTKATINYTCFALDYPTVKDVAEVVAEALEGYLGQPQGAPTPIQGLFIDDEFDGYDPPEFADQAGVHRVELVAEVSYSGK
jgi:hypothetical protein